MVAEVAGVSPNLGPSTSGTGTYQNLTGLPEGVRKRDSIQHYRPSPLQLQNCCMQIELYQDLLFPVQSHNDSM